MSTLIDLYLAIIYLAIIEALKKAEISCAERAYPNHSIFVGEKGFSIEPFLKNGKMGVSDLVSALKKGFPEVADVTAFWLVLRKNGHFPAVYTRILSEERDGEIVVAARMAEEAGLIRIIIKAEPVRGEGLFARQPDPPLVIDLIEGGKLEIPSE